MTNSIPKEAKTKELKQKHSFGFTEVSDTNGAPGMSTKDPDTMLSMTVLLVVCLTLAFLAHVFV